MDESTLRLILLVVGVCIIAGIYLFDKFKKRPTRPVRLQPDFFAEAAEKLRYKPRNKAKPIERTVRDEPEDDLGLSGMEPMSAVTDDVNLDALDESLDSREYETLDDPAEVQETDLPQPEPEQAPAEPETDVPPGAIIQLSVTALSGSVFAGKELLGELTDLGMEYGDMGIFHCYQHAPGDERILFHLVNMVEPGTFPIGNMQDFQTPGVSFFFQASEVAEPIPVFNQMLDVAETLADRMSGQVLNANRQPLSRADLEAIYQTLGGGAGAPE